MFIKFINLLNFASQTISEKEGNERCTDSLTVTYRGKVPYHVYLQTTTEIPDTLLQKSRSKNNLYAKTQRENKYGFIRGTPFICYKFFDYKPVQYGIASH